MLEALIIGAGPAGCVAAISLARRGHRVAMVEQHRFPRNKVCGECLSALGIDVLARLGLKETLLTLRPVRLTRGELVSPGGRAAEVELPAEMWGLSRGAMDSALLDEARRAGVEVMQPARWEARDGSVVRDLVTNEVRGVASRFVLLADGKSPAKTGDLGVKAHFVDVDSSSDTISLFGLRGHYVGLAAVEGARWNLAMSVPAARVRGLGGDLDALFERICGENVELGRRMKTARRVGDWLTCALPRSRVAPSWPAKVVPVGNAAAALEPIGGEGMGLAMRSAEMAAEAVDAALREGRAVDVVALRREYQRLWRWRSMTARGTAWVMSRPACAEVLVRAMRRWDFAVRPVLVPLGK